MPEKDESLKAEMSELLQADRERLREKRPTAFLPAEAAPEPEPASEPAAEPEPLPAAVPEPVAEPVAERRGFVRRLFG
jgi:hypothetical protein